MDELTTQAQIDGAKAYEGLLVPALFGEWASRVVDAATVEPGSTVLDIACGTGCLARELGLRVGHSGSVTGLDPNPGMLAVAGGQSSGIDWKLGTAESLPFGDRTFDAVLSQFGIMFFSDRSRALSEIQRVLVPGGRVAVAAWDELDSMPAYVAEVNLLERIAGEEAADALRAPFSMGDRAALEEHLQSAGLRNVEVSSQAGTARFPSVRSFLESDLRGWLPIMGVNLSEEMIDRIITEGEVELSDFVADDGGLEFTTQALIATGRKPEST